MPGYQDLIAAGLTVRQIDYWTTRGYLRADTNNPGTGHDRSWSGDELRVARTMARLAKAGLTPAAAHEVARGRAQLAPGVCVLIDGEVPANA